MTVQAAAKLLDEFRKVSGRIERPPTFMEIAGYPHYEDVCSNFLKFFMDPEKAHGLRTLVLDALLASAGDGATADEGVGGNVSIEREVITDKGRIDLLITSDDHAILIENKLLADVNNPLEDYSAYLDRIANGRTQHKFLLTLYPTHEGSSCGFTNLAYEKFVGRVRSLLGRYVSGADTRYLTMFLDFLNTLDNLKRGTRMNQEFVRLLSQRSDEVDKFLAELRSFQDEMRFKVQTLGSKVNLREYQNISQRFWRPRTSLVDMLIYDIGFWKGQRVEVAAIVRPQEWTIRFQLLPGDPSKLRALLERLDIPNSKEEWIVHSEHFKYDDSLDQIRPVLQNVVDKLATSQEREE